MTTYTGTQRGRAPFATSGFGNAWLGSNKVTPAAALGTSDVVVLMDVPAGVELHTLFFRGGDFDTGTTLDYKIGYRTKLPGGSATDDDYFTASNTALRAATTSWQELVFDPIKFNEPVEIILTPTAAATGVSGTPSVFTRAEGEIVGIS